MRHTHSTGHLGSRPVDAMKEIRPADFPSVTLPTDGSIRSPARQGKGAGAAALGPVARSCVQTSHRARSGASRTSVVVRWLKGWPQGIAVLGESNAAVCGNRAACLKECRKLVIHLEKIPAAIHYQDGCLLDTDALLATETARNSRCVCQYPRPRIESSGVKAKDFARDCKAKAIYSDVRTRGRQKSNDRIPEWH